MADKATIGSVVSEFTKHIDSLRSSVGLSMKVIQNARKAAGNKYQAFIDENCKELTKDGRKIVLVPPEHYPRYRALEREVEHTHIAERIVPTTFLVSLVSHYDAFLGQLVSVLLRLKPELLKTSERLLTFSQLSDFGSIDAAREFILEKETETLLRKSHVEQFEFLEKKFDIKLHTDLPIWSTFIEVTERRNLFVHSNGIVSTQYLKVCTEEGVKFTEAPKIGTKLGAPRRYFHSAHAAIYEIGVKLAQVLWRKLFPSDLAEADDNLTALTYELIQDEEYELSKTLLDFACRPPMKHADERRRLIFLVNMAQVHKWSGDQKGTLEIVKKQDWTATSPEFQLAEAVLLDRYEEAGKIMRQIGKGGNPSKEAYRIWPLFREFRKTKEFETAYQDVFNEQFLKPEAIEKSETKEDKKEPPNDKNGGLIQ